MDTHHTHIHHHLTLLLNVHTSHSHWTPSDSSTECRHRVDRMIQRWWWWGGGGGIENDPTVISLQHPTTETSTPFKVKVIETGLKAWSSTGVSVCQSLKEHVDMGTEKKLITPTPTCTHTNMCAHAQTHTCANTCAQAHTQIRAHTPHTRMCTHTHTHTHTTHTHNTHNHTHTRERAKPMERQPVLSPAGFLALQSRTTLRSEFSLTDARFRMITCTNMQNTAWKSYSHFCWKNMGASVVQWLADLLQVHVNSGD